MSEDNAPHGPQAPPSDPLAVVAGLVEQAVVDGLAQDSAAGAAADPSQEGGEVKGASAPVDWALVERCAAEPETDIGNGRRFLHRFGDAALSVEGLGWAAFDGRRWVLDFFNSEVRPLAHATVELIRLEGKFVRPAPDEEAAVQTAEEAFPRFRELKKKGGARTPEDELELLRLGEIVGLGAEAAKAISERRATRIRYGKSSCSTGKMDNMLAEARVYRSTPVSALDADPYAVNLENGTLRFFQGPGANGKPGLWTGRLDPHRREDLISKLAPVTYEAGAECPQFERFVEQILPQDEVAKFLQRFLGYCLLALTREQVFVFLYGLGRNGKSTLVDIVCRILGDYTTTVPFETLAGDDRRKGGDATPDLVRVPGARIVRASEPESGMKFRESMVKSLTSGEPILIRRMREEFIEVYPTFKLVISGNHKPDVRGGDEGIWRRVLLVPFTEQIPKEDVDRNLPEKLWDERSGILNWLIAGALTYLESGLSIPDAVRGATDDYREASDAIAAFLRGACEITGLDSDFEMPGKLHAAYKLFCEQQGFYPLGPSTFNKQLPERAAQFGFRKAKTNGLSVYRGLLIKPAFAPPDPSHTHGGRDGLF